MTAHRSFAWYVNRLGAMSAREIVHRAVRLASHPFVPAFARIMSAASTSKRQFPITSYFDTSCSSPLEEHIRRRADDACDGRRSVLGLGVLDAPSPPWHWEPLARQYWPSVASNRVRSRAPAGHDIRLTWEMNRGHDWVALARAWSATKQQRYRDVLVRELESWTRDNPLLRGVNWVSAMEAAIRIHSLFWIASFLQSDCPPIVGQMLQEHEWFVRLNRSYFSSANNHLIVELSALAVAARYRGQDPARIIAELESQLERQVWPDGVGREMATHYHAFVLEAVLLVAFLERRHGASRKGLEQIAVRMAEYLDALNTDDGFLHQADNDDGVIVVLFADRYEHQLIEAARALVRPVDNASPATGVFWLTNGQSGPASPRSLISKQFEQSRQIVLKSERLHVVFDAGSFGLPSLYAHAHCDALAISCAYDMRPIFVDRGTYRYNGDPVGRDLFRSTKMHNTIQVGQREQGEATGPFMWRRVPNVSIERCDLQFEGDIVIAKHDGFAPAIHRRTIVRKANELLIQDEVSPTEPFTARYHLAPSLALAAIGGHDGSFDVCDSKTAAVLARIEIRGSHPSLALRVVETEHSERYAARTKAVSLEARALGGTITLHLSSAEGGPRDGIYQFATNRGVSVNNRALSSVTRTSRDQPREP